MNWGVYMVMVTLKSDLFGDRRVAVNVPSKLGETARTGDGSGDAVFITKCSDGYRMKIHRRNTVIEKQFQRRKDVLESAAKFLAPVC